MSKQQQQRKQLLVQIEQLQEQIFVKLQLIRSHRSREDEWINQYLRTQRSGNQATYPKFQKHLSYYQQFWKTYLVNQMMIVKIKQLSQENQFNRTIIQQLELLQRKHSQLMQIKNKKKQRRTNSQIQKKYKCPYFNCDKDYGCDVALNLHIKIKHNGGNKTQREKLALQIIRAQETGQPLPNINLQFPPGYLQKFRKGGFKQTCK